MRQWWSDEYEEKPEETNSSALSTITSVTGSHLGLNIRRGNVLMSKTAGMFVFMSGHEHVKLFTVT